MISILIFFLFLGPGGPLRVPSITIRVLLFHLPPLSHATSPTHEHGEHGHGGHRHGGHIHVEDLPSPIWSSFTPGATVFDLPVVRNLFQFFVILTIWTFGICSADIRRLLRKTITLSSPCKVWFLPQKTCLALPQKIQFPSSSLFPLFHQFLSDLIQ